MSDPAERETFLESLELRLTRTAAFLARLADATPGSLGAFLAALARALADWAAGLAAALRALDRYSPGWKAIPGA